ncbi:MAG: hypothetical protein CBB71_09910 [Rhodopirellula sp. TMED11]|nr:MAG: hypothetical protein CBB71_09910 [Rhodopirellula sp. TMED11]
MIRSTRETLGGSLADRTQARLKDSLSDHRGSQFGEPHPQVKTWQSRHYSDTPEQTLDRKVLSLAELAVIAVEGLS